ncbi:TIGR02270 family protein [Pseudorhodoferax aquiterrae]|uniref:TIGR02270 family protein n=1 Tax=Pseudorhodoferax aquiterrae TaxID=747304 RepID=UPI001E4F8F20|nr:TIGR02270 family protein [Pseudorhodoferax aquiterrae]
MQAPFSPIPTQAEPAMLSRLPIPAIVQQHADEAAHLRHVRSVLVRAPHVRLLQLGRLDERLDAHLDGLAVAGAEGLARAQVALEQCGCGEVFTAFAAALQARDADLQQRVLALAPAVPEAWRGIVSALGWSSAPLLREPVRMLLAAAPPWQRALGLEACRLHGVDPGPALAPALRADDPVLRLSALRTAAALGRTELLPLVLAALDAPPLAGAAARSACLLGDRGTALRALERAAFATPAACDPLRPLAVQALPPEQARAQLRELMPAAPREAVRAIGWLGDARLVPWLIERMEDVALARVAGEAFSTITGADLVALELEQPPPADLQTGPSDDPDDEDVALDDDENLPWPDPARVQRWWQARAGAFAAPRCFVGAAPTPAHLGQVLRTGTQRQRALAAQLLVLLQPGQAGFNVAAPTWRQRRLLGLPGRGG